MDSWPVMMKRWSRGDYTPPVSCATKLEPSGRWSSLRKARRKAREIQGNGVLPAHRLSRRYMEETASHSGYPHPHPLAVLQMFPAD